MVAAKSAGSATATASSPRGGTGKHNASSASLGPVTNGRGTTSLSPSNSKDGSLGRNAKEAGAKMARSRGLEREFKVKHVGSVGVIFWFL